jgi:hypothetical protein
VFIETAVTATTKFDVVGRIASMWRRMPKKREFRPAFLAAMEADAFEREMAPEPVMHGPWIGVVALPCVMTRSGGGPLFVGPADGRSMLSG